MKNLSILLLCILFIGCDSDLEYSGLTNFIYRNSSSHKVTLEAYYEGELNESFTLEKGREKMFKDGLREGENNPAYDRTRYHIDDSVVTIFDDTLSISYDKGRVDGNPMRIENYKLVETETEPYVYLFEFTNEDYQRALERGRVVKP
ncbi:hypothetical protein QYS48_17850 [Marivirga arenosa]|uniref:Lipoprotein n=1 Tax=Marivirga arenosa TaxID=3059076 RepID=A0AA49JDA6_9BACT|nr:hypothetical protein [Marivirga sp. ABR2-2]WKK84072.2 hypothetical protein QYS48_17850 [Marivirga sp. ABR2-2]